MFGINPAEQFNDELLCIENPFYLKMAVDALHRVPDYFWYVPASSSGKYHPKSSLGMGGLVRHVRAVFRVSEELLSNKSYSPFSSEERDQIRVAILLHDACKQGLQNNPSATRKDHPLLVREALNPLREGDVTTDDLEGTTFIGRMSGAWDTICNLIETHMGVWNTDDNGVEIMDVPKTKAQIHVHMCDYLASRACIEVDTWERKEQASQKESKAWRKELATQGQIDYIKKLSVMCIEKQVTNQYKDMIIVQDGKICINKGEASNVIEGLKKKLGIG